jgi:hypothetical protein
MSRIIPIGAVLSLVLGAATACDIAYRVIVTAPLAHPLSTDCIRSALDKITRSTRTTVEPDKYPPNGARGTLFQLGGGTPYELVRQFEYGDSTAALETHVMRFPSPRFSKPEADGLGREMGATLLRVRDACGGSGRIGSSPYQIKRQP